MIFTEDVAEERRIFSVCFHDLLPYALILSELFNLAIDMVHNSLRKRQWRIVKQDNLEVFPHLLEELTQAWPQSYKEVQVSIGQG